MKAIYFENKPAKILLHMAAAKFSKYSGISRFSPAVYGDIPEPGIQEPNWLKIKNRSCGLCGTDMHFMFFNVDTKSFSAATPGIKRKFLGHEVLGTVHETGGGVKGFKKGERVTMRIDWPSCNQLEISPRCPQCEAGSYMLCENLGVKEYRYPDIGGGFSPWMLMHKTQPYKIPDAMSDDQALMLEPLACAAHGVLKSLPRPGARVLVYGCGTMGLLTIAAARALAPKAEIHAITNVEHPVKMAEKMGADRIIRAGKNLYQDLASASDAKYHRGLFGNEILLGGYDVVYDCVGSDATINSSLRFARGNGSVVIIGINFYPGKIDYSTVWNQEIKLTGMNCHSDEAGGKNSFDIALELITRKKVNTEGMITHRFKMEDYKNAVRAFINKNESKAIKIILEH